MSGTQDATIPLLVCPACRAGSPCAFTLGPGVELRRCAACGCVHAPAYADPDAVFVEGYLSGGAGDFGIDVSSPRFQAFLAEIGDRRERTIRRVVGAPGSLLDVGCGSGEFTARAAAAGWRVVGVEPIEDAARAARDRGLDVRTGTLKTTDAGGGYDVVSAFHVLEHMPDGPAFLAELAARARPGGLVAVESPNWDSAIRRRFGTGWPHLRPLEHLVHLTPATLAVAMRTAGLEPVLVTTPLYLFSRALPGELAPEIAHPERAGLLKRLSPGGPHAPASPLAHAVARAVAAVHERRGRGSALLGLARVPG